MILDWATVFSVNVMGMGTNLDGNGTVTNLNWYGQGCYYINTSERVRNL